MGETSNKSYSTTQRPNQRVSVHEKQQKRWYIPNGEFNIKYCESHNTDKDVIDTLYRAANGIIDVNDYNYVTNPFHATNPKLKQYPAKLRNHDIIQPILLRHLGEYLKADFKPIVGINNADVVSKKMEAKKAHMKPILDTVFADEMARATDGAVSLSAQTGENEQAPNPKAVEEEFENSWKDERAIRGQAMLNYLRDELNLDHKYISNYVNWLTAGQYYSYTTVKNDKVYHVSVDPREAYPVLNGSEFIEDCNMFMRKYKMSLNDIGSYFRDELEQKDLEYVEQMMSDLNYERGSLSMSNALVSDRYGNAYEYFKGKYGNEGVDISVVDDEGLIDVYHTVWTTQTQIQILVYADNLGRMQKKEVTIDYKLDLEAGDLHLEKEWVNEMWEQTRIGDEALGLYTVPKPVATQRHEVNNTANVKCPYGGKAFMYEGLMNPSIVKPLLPYQVIYNVLYYHREMAIANNVGNILVMPKGLLVDDDEISQEEAVYYIKADKKLYVDETADNFSNAQQAIRSVNASDAEYIRTISEILAQTKEEAWDSVGMNRQRYGDTYASEGKGTQEQAIYRASMGTAPITEVFNQARYKDYMALIDNSKVAYLEDDNEAKTIGSYLNDEGRLEYLTIYPKEFLESEIGLYVASFTRDQEKIQQYKEVAFAASQNGAFELGLEAIEFENPHKLKEILKKWRLAEDKKEQQQQQAAQEAAQAEKEHELNMLQSKLDTEIEVAKIRASATVDAAAIKVEVTAMEGDIRNNEQVSKEKIEDAKNVSKERTEKYKTDSQKDIAKTNAKKQK